MYVTLYTLLQSTGVVSVISLTTVMAFSFLGTVIIFTLYKLSIVILSVVVSRMQRFYGINIANVTAIHFVLQKL